MRLLSDAITPPSSYLEYVDSEARNRFEVEHIWANKPDRHLDEFTHAADFDDVRNRLGGLLLLPTRFNASYGAHEYETKRQHYVTHNLLARSLHPQAYDHNPGFRQFVNRSGLQFRPHQEFRRADLEERQVFYREIAKLAWDPKRLETVE